MFVCHGNICRSPMAEFVFKDILKREGRESDFFVASSATSCEEIGNSVQHGTVRKLAQYGISCAGKRAVRLRKDDYDKAIKAHERGYHVEIIGEISGGKRASMSCESFVVIE